MAATQHPPRSAASAAARRRPPAPSTAARSALARLRRACADWGGVSEAPSFGHPALRVRGVPFAVLDRYRGHACLWLRVAPPERAALLATHGWFPAPYDPRQGALCVRLEAIDWRRIRPLLRISYALAAGGPARSARRPAGR
jgi:hypothetical protein